MIIITKQDIKTEMKTGNPLILINTNNPEQNPTYRVLLQTPNELPAHDLGYNKIRYNPETIKTKIKQLEGQFIYDETQTAHNKRKTPENRGHRFGKVINTGYCPQYGGYGDITIFDKEYQNLLEEAYNSVNEGLPIHEGPSTEVSVISAGVSGDNNLDVDDWDYTGLVWDKQPRDLVGVCKVLNSITEVLEDNKMTDEFKMSKKEYDNLKQVETDKLRLESEIATLRAEKVQGKADWLQFQQQFNDLKTEKEDLFTQLVPVWTQQGEQKLEMVNSILETIPEAEKEAKKAELEKLGITELGIITNSLPTPAQQGHGVTGGSGTGRTPPEEEGEFTNDKYLEICEKHGIKP